MVISKNSQLGLRLDTKETAITFLEHLKSSLKRRIDIDEKVVEYIKSMPKNEDGTFNIQIDETHELFNDVVNACNDQTIEVHKTANQLRDELKGHFDIAEIFLNVSNKVFYICESVYTAASLIKIKSGFTGRVMKDIGVGRYTYLMGKNRCVKFEVDKGFIMGLYYDDLKGIAFAWGIRIEDGAYIYEDGYPNEFTTIMQVLTFVELGDITVKELPAGRNNGGKKNVDKITNTSNNTVFVVDSTWNTIVVRTEGFAVRGHFRLQSCGEGHKDRKLTWIDAFEKHGYTRRPKAEIIHD